MNEKRQRSEFLEEFLEEIEEKAAKDGLFQSAFMEQMLIYMDRPDDPNILLPPYNDSNRKIAVHAYAYDEEQQSLDLYVVDYNFDQNEDDLLSITKTGIIDIANRAKRFFTNAKGLSHTIDQSLQTRELALLIANDSNIIDEVNIYVLTNTFYLSNKPVELSIPGVDNVNVQIWDIDRILQLVMAEQGIQTIYIDFENDFHQTFEMMFVPDPQHDGIKDNFDCYIGFISAELLAKVYDEWGQKLVERNVRSFLQARGGTNKGIRDTLKNPNQRQMFVSYNNGISSVARSGDIEQLQDNINLYRIKGLTGWQIVNGGQTTASIYRAYKSGIELKDVYVQTKLTILQVETDHEKDQHLLEDEMVSRISQFANTQNKINKSDLLANTRFLSDLEKFSRNTWIPSTDGRKAETKWYFERARGQYMVDVNRRKRGKEQNDFKKLYPKEKVLKKVELAKYFMSWEGYPHISSKGGEEAFKRFMDQNKQYWKHEKDDNDEIIPLKELKLETYKTLIARTIINQHVTAIVKEMKLSGYRANVVYYTTAMLNHLYGDYISLEGVWDNQSLSAKWDDVIQTIAGYTLSYLRDSSGERNVTQWAKQEACWTEFKEKHVNQLSNLI